MEIPEPLQAQVNAEFPQQPIRIRRVAEEQSVLPQTTVQVGFDAFRMGQLWVSNPCPISTGGWAD